MELLPARQILFNRMEGTVRRVFESFGYLPLDTPVLEHAGVLLAKAGGETEKQIYRFSKGDTDMVMRFDLTVPLAKYVAKNYNELAFPFRRYQIGKVYRGERPQKGRFREFHQCDVDAVGDGKLNVLYDAEMAAVIYAVFSSLRAEFSGSGFPEIKIYISNRKILSGFLTGLGLAEQASGIMGVVDKLKKIGTEKVRAELLELGISEKSVGKIMEFVSLSGTTDELLSKLTAISGTHGLSAGASPRPTEAGSAHVAETSVGRGLAPDGASGNALFFEGVSELAEVVKGIRFFGVPEENFAIDLIIVRGLDYYTGTVYETFLEGFEGIGSICSGGRYDDLAGYYTDKKLPGVGISIGLTRLFDKLSDLLGQKAAAPAATVLVLSPDGATCDACIAATAELRGAGISAQVYLEDAKAKAKFKYADRLNIPYVMIIGEDEKASDTVTLKNMATGEQKEKIPLRLAAEELLSVPGRRLP